VDMPIAEYLVGNLDDNGWLRCSIQETADMFDVSSERVEIVLRHLQSLDPIGIGARDLRECLLIQMDYLEDQGITHPQAREIIKKHLTQLGEHKFGRIASEMGISAEEVADVWSFIKSHLNPFPAQGYGVPEPGPSEPIRTYVMPDVIISKDERGFEVDVVESKRFIMRLSPIYSQLAQELDRGDGRLSDDERRHIQQYVSRAKLFIANINQRRQTIQRITTMIVEEQTAFLSNGIRHLQPLTRAQVAGRLGMHESTVSRATAAKYVMLPDGHVIPFSDFFTASLSVKDVIKELIASEEAPLTDQEIAERLDERGIHVARRTVAKYREQLGILPSSLR
jgi:RNA polymerase sigma-54 factor